MKYFSVDSPFGGKLFYDENNEPVGYSVDSCFGGELFYDSSNNPKGYSVENCMGSLFYDKDSEPAGYSVNDEMIFDKDSNCIGWMQEGFYSDSLF